MSRYYFRKVVDADGSIVLSGLPPSQEVQVIVVGQDRKGKEFAEEMRSLIERVWATHPFAQMSEEEIVKKLRETREVVAAERHETQTKERESHQSPP